MTELITEKEIQAIEDKLRLNRADQRDAHILIAALRAEQEKVKHYEAATPWVCENPGLCQGLAEQLETIRTERDEWKAGAITFEKAELKRRCEALEYADKYFRETKALEKLALQLEKRTWFVKETVEYWLKWARDPK